METGLASKESLEGFAEILKIGPIGLAGAMLILVVVALALKPTASRERTLTKFLYVGAGCFTLTLAAQFFAPQPGGAYQLRLVVQPLDAGRRQALPMPLIRVNNDAVPDSPPRAYTVRSDATAIIDVTDAIAFVQEFRSQNARQRDAIEASIGELGAAGSAFEAAIQHAESACIEKVMRGIPSVDVRGTSTEGSSSPSDSDTGRLVRQHGSTVAADKGPPDAVEKVRERLRESLLEPVPATP